MTWISSNSKKYILAVFFRETVPTMQRLNWHSWSCASASSPSAHRSGVRGASPLVACGVFAARCFVVQLLEHFGGAELGFGLPQLLQSLCLQVCGGERDVSGSPSETRREAEFVHQPLLSSVASKSLSSPLSLVTQREGCLRTLPRR